MACRLKILASTYLIPAEYEPDSRLIEEMCRYGACELHCVAAFLGGAVAHEAVKLLTGQYVPINNTFLYDANTGSGAAFQF